MSTKSTYYFLESSTGLTGDSKGNGASSKFGEATEVVEIRFELEDEALVIGYHLVSFLNCFDFGIESDNLLETTYRLRNNAYIRQNVANMQTQ